MRRTIFGLVLVCAVSRQVVAADWTEIASNRDMTLLVDGQSVKSSGKLLKVWTKAYWVTPQDVPNTKKVFQSMVQQQLVDCSSGSLAIVQWLRYSEPSGGDLIDSQSYDETKTQLTDPAPGSFGESIVKFTCQRSAPTPR